MEAVFHTMNSANVTALAGHTLSTVAAGIVATLAVVEEASWPSIKRVLTPVLPWLTTVIKRH